jgi:RelA/SpoT family (p)ppGpp synthetase|tara:strand:+ start:2026 stop:4140 length:2115 start_codon:yes stop_codon:yes gene_type:complete
LLTIDSLAEDLDEYLDKKQIAQVRKAYAFAEKAHEGQFRETGDPYITHPLAVAAILAGMHMDHQCLMAALLHDVMEDTGVAKHILGKKFDSVIADLVDGVSKLENIERSRVEAQAENFQKMALAMAKDLRVILVKLADRLHNMRTLDPLEPEKRRRIAKETLEIYAPIANRLGMNSVRVEFEELGFKTLHPMRSMLIEKAVKKARGNRKEVVSQIGLSLQNRLKNDGIKGEIIGREKHLYSIYDKMRTKRKTFYEIMDVYAFRIIVDDVDTCYRVLGAVHNLYKPVAGRVKDYIAIPKANGYQSLHTTLFGMHALPIEIQIRTHEMEAIANNGIAGHWLYKAQEDSENGSHVRAREWLKGLLDLQQSAGDSVEFIENVKIDLFPDEVYVFTPRGEILALAQGATPVDFAYTVHTDIGNTCVACRIDRRLAPLSSVLESGQTVEIITAPGAHPNPAWLGYVITGKARSSIRHALKTQQTSESIDLGRRLLERTLNGLNSSLDKINTRRLKKILKERGFTELDKLLEEIGLGNQMSYVIAKTLLSDDSDIEERQTIAQQGPFAIRGTEGLVVNYAKCCKPIPGDPIMGHVSSGRGIVIHTDNCKNIADLRDKPEETMAVRWDTQIEGEFSVELRVEIEHRRGMIAILASSVTDADANIERISMVERDALLSIVNITLGVADRDHLARVIRRMRTITGNNKITRVRS